MDSLKALVLDMSKLKITARQTVLRVDRLEPSGGQFELVLAAAAHAHLWIHLIADAHRILQLHLQGLDCLREALKERLNTLNVFLALVDFFLHRVYCLLCQHANKVSEFFLVELQVEVFLDF